MTLDAFRDRALEAALPKGGAKELSPIALAILTAALVAAAAQLASDCVHRLVASDVRSPNALQRARLRWLYVRPAVREAIAAHPGAGEVDPWHVEGLVTQGLLDAAKGLSDGEFEGLKAQAMGAR